MNDMFAFLRESGEKPEPNSGMKIMAGVSHSSKRIHDYEKHYSPALKEQGGYSSISELKEQEERERRERERREREREAEEEREREAERERIEYCKEHERRYNGFIEAGINQGVDIKDINEYIQYLNNYFGGKGCPPLPEIEREPPTFAAKR